MAPFPEDEIMTIKRLEVALRKSDFKLLKEGAYKLHEKYHSKYQFQYFDLLEEILDEVQANYAIPYDIKDILIPTIKDILLNKTNGETNRVSSLTSLSYGINNQYEKNEVIINNNETSEDTDYSGQNQQFKLPEEFPKPFQEFAPIKPAEADSNISYKKEEPIEELKDDIKSITESYNQQPIEDFDTGTPIVRQQNIFQSNFNSEPIEYLSQDKKEETRVEEPQKFDTFEDIKYEETISEPIKEIEEPVSGTIQETVSEPTETFIKPAEETVEYVQEDVEPIAESIDEPVIETIEEPAVENIEETVKETFIEPVEEEIQEKDEEYEEETSKQKNITIFFGQNFSNEKIKNIIKYQELINSKGNFSLNEITSLINEIKTQADTNVSEIQTFLEQIKSKNHKVNLLTNSQSANFVDLFSQSNMTYSIFDNSEDKKVNFMPIFGLTNLYKCVNCENEFLELNEKVNSFILQCPKCKSAMFPDIYTPKGQLNMDYYNSALVALANSDVWLLICPPLNEKLIFNLIKSAINVSSKVKEIYILDKDINTRETYRKIAQEIHPDIKISNSMNTIEDFLNNI